MKRHSISTFVTISVVAALMSSCGSDSSTKVTSLSALPTATGPVAGSGSRTLRLAANGRKLTEWANNGGDGWGGTKSGAMCKAGGMVMRMLSDASNPDLVLCFIGAMEANQLFTPSYDGSSQFYTLRGMTRNKSKRPNRTAGDTLLKFSTTKSGDAISDFKMWACNVSRNRTTQPFMYNSISLSGGTARVTSVSEFSEGLYAFSQRTVVAGNFNSSGEWTSKTITNTGNFSGDTAPNDFQQRQYMTLTQGADNFILDGYFSGYWNGDTNTQTGEFYAKMQGLNLANLDTAALGDGTAKYHATFGGGNYSNTQSWTGDDQSVITADTGVYYDDVNGHALPTNETISAPALTGTEIWDCDSGGQTSTVVDLQSTTFTSNTNLQTALNACKAKYDFDSDSKYTCMTGAF